MEGAAGGLDGSGAHQRQGPELDARRGGTVASKTASSSRSITVSEPQSCPGAPVVSGRPLNVTRPVKGLELLQKKPAGMGFWAKS